MRLRLATMDTHDYIVTEADTAIALGSGDLPVLGSPRLIAWFEAAAMASAAVALDADHTTVGTTVKIEHVRACPVGSTVRVSCSKPVNDGRRLIFNVKAKDETGEEIGHGEVHRAVVDRERFLSRFGA